MIMDDVSVVWKPLPGTSQELALDSRAHHTLYTGARGPGKTDTQLMRFRRRVGLGYGSFWRGIIFDREYKNLDDLVAKSKRWFFKFGDGAKFLESNSSYKWVWPTGEELLFRVVKKDDDYWNYHGQEFPFIGWNELTKYPTPNLYDMMMSINRSSFTPEKDNESLPPIPLEVFSTCNPYGSGHNWVKSRFIDPAPYGTIVKNNVEVFNPKTKSNLIVCKTQVAIFGSYIENPYLSPEYIAELASERDENRRKAWFYGDWDIVAGGALDDVWDKRFCIIPRFAIPSNWTTNRSFDWGSSEPFSVGWWAEANGEEVLIPMPDGTSRKFCPYPGSLIQFYEWYGSKEIGLNKGLKLSATKIAEGIRDREIALMESGWIERQPWPGPADNQISNVTEVSNETIAKKMLDVGIRWTESDKSKGSRKNGLQVLRDRLEACRKAENKAIYFMDNCRASIATLPTLPRDGDDLDDVDTDSEDHVYDMVRYRVLSGNNRLATSIKIVKPS